MWGRAMTERNNACDFTARVGRHLGPAWHISDEESQPAGGDLVHHCYKLGRCLRPADYIYKSGSRSRCLPSFRKTVYTLRGVCRHTL